MLNLELRLSVEDSPNSAGETIDAIRCCKLAREANLSGPLEAISAYTMKHPPKQYTDAAAHEMLEAFIAANTPAPPTIGSYQTAAKAAQTAKK